ncbi:MAG TPA: TetR/AcrR family transcriptional regulator [Chloroflexi bacterium]|nr:TetR/AcrR family transcriptional regulator [Chloroflexota bacterium]
MTTRREKQRQATLEEIKTVARQQMAEYGAAALSLNGIAREMGLTTPALYRYFASRDALVTELIVEAFQSLGDAIEQADAEKARNDFYGRFQSMAHAYRHWAIAHPQDYDLIFGTPIPHYHAPKERTVPLASRIPTLFGILLHEAEVAGKVEIPVEYGRLSPPMQQIVQAIAAALPLENRPPNADVSEKIIIAATLIHVRLFGLVWAELHYLALPETAVPGELFQIELNILTNQIKLEKTA